MFSLVFFREEEEVTDLELEGVIPAHCLSFHCTVQELLDFQLELPSSSTCSGLGWEIAREAGRKEKPTNAK
jgi:hypothetical protein